MFASLAARKHMPYAEMAAYRAAVMMPWDLNLVMFHVARTKDTTHIESLGDGHDGHHPH